MTTEPQNPLGLHLDFLFGRGYLWAKEERLNDWISLDQLKMEIPDLAFPFDVRGGLQRFQHTRCLIHEIGMSVSEVGLGDLLRQGARELDGFDDLQVNFVDGAAHVTTRVRALGANTFLSFRVGLIPPEPSRADEVHLSLYDYRAYGPLPYPARVLGFEFLSRMLQTTHLKPPGRGTAYKVGIAGDLLSLRPLKLILLHVFAKAGWKLPDLSFIKLDSCRVKPGALEIRARVPSRSEQAPMEQRFGASVEGARAIAAYEAKDLFAEADQALFNSSVELAFQRYSELRQSYGNHPGLVDRILDVLLASPTVANLVEAESICRDLEREDPNNIRGLLARATISALKNEDDTDARYKALSEALRARGETFDYVLSELSRAEHVQSRDPERAATILSELLNVAPRHRGVLESLRRLYEELGDTAQLESVLKRLTGVYSDRESLAQTYLELASHLIDRRGEVSEARVFLERVLRLDPTHVEALNILGESYLLAGEPLRALRAFSSASRAAEDRGDVGVAAGYLFRVAKLWDVEIGDQEQALLASRRALQLSRDLSAYEPQRLEHLLMAAKLCADKQRFDESIGYYLDAANGYEQLVEAGDIEATVLASIAHHALGDIYWARERFEIAADHYERAFTLDPDAEDVLERLEDAYMRAGMPDKLLGLYRETVQRDPSSPSTVPVRVKLATLLARMGLREQAETTLQKALQLQPDSVEARVALFSLFAESGRVRDLESTAERMTTQMQNPETRSAVLSDLADALDRAGRDADLSAVARLRAFDAAPSERRAIEGVLELSDRGVELPGLEDALIRIMGRPGKAIRAEGVEERLDSLLGETLAAVEQDSVPEEVPRGTLEESTASLEADFDEDDLRVFREKFEETKRNRFELPDPTKLSENSAMSRVLRRTPETPAESSAPAVPTTPAKTLPEKLRSPAAPSDGLSHLRNGDDPMALADALRVAIANAATDQERLKLEKEVGELLYFELEDAAKAQPYLERVRELDPDGLGADANLLAALEAIYEESGDLSGRVIILEERLRRAESDEMRTVYRLLLAQTTWEAYRSRERAEGWLEPVLKKDPKHEAANRLLGDIALEAKDYVNAVRRFETVIEVSPDGLDAVEVERELAEIYLLKLNDPERALKHYRAVLDAAPGDSRALDGVKQCQATTGDWEGYIASLSHELGLLLGRFEFSIEQLPTLDVEKISPPLRVPASQIVMDIARIVVEQKPAESIEVFQLAYELWPEQVEAIERVVNLTRHYEPGLSLADALEVYAGLLLNPSERFETLSEAARIFADHSMTERARELYATAIAIAETDASVEGVDAVRREFQRLSKSDA